MKKALSLFLLSVVSMGALLISCREHQKKETLIRSTPVTLARVEKQELSRPIRAYGRLFPEKEIRLSFKTGGIIREMKVSEGQSVEQGQLLARLDLAEIKAQVAAAAGAHEKTKRDLERVKNLYADRAATLEQYQDAKTALQLTESNLQAAEFNLRFSEIRAPGRGCILKRLARENELIAPGMPVFLFAATENEWLVRLGLSDRELLRLNIGDAARIEFEAFPGKFFSAEVSEIAQAPDPHTGTYKVELTTDKGIEPLLTGLVVKADIFPADREPLYVIPAQSLVSASEGKAVVFTIDPEGNKARHLDVTLAYFFADQAAIRSGLEGIERVVAAGAAYLSEGMLLEVVEASALGYSSK